MRMYILDEIKNLLKEAIKSIIEEDIEPIIEYPPSPKLGDLASPIAFQIAKKRGETKKEQRKLAIEIANDLAGKLAKKELKLVKEVEALNGFLNFRLDFPIFAKNVISQVLSLKEKYGHQDIGKGKTIIVEHTSANPIHPLHIGTARNAILGDTIFRIYKALGYNVIRLFYVNDMGKQVAYLVYGYNLVKEKLKPVGKIDHWFGALYSAIVTAIEAIKEAKKIFQERELLLENSSLDEVDKIHLRTLIERYIASNWPEILKRYLGEPFENEFNKAAQWSNALSEILLKWPMILLEVLKKVKDNAEEEIANLVKKYERGDEQTIRSFREVATQVLKGFQETLERVGIGFDGFDWESNLVFSGLVDDILKKLEKWTEIREGAIYLRIRDSLRELEGIRKIFDIPKDVVERAFKEGKLSDLPSDLVLKRSDGTTLYTTRDIAYSVYKFEKYGAEKVLNIIGKDQTLAQKQVKAALYLAGYKEYSENLIHVAYEMVILKEGKLSSRRGRYITFDEIIEEAKRIALKELIKRYPEESFEKLNERAEKIAVGAIRYALLSVAPEKVLEFEWSKILDFERNSGPFLQYTYVRALSILKKANVADIDVNSIDFSVLKTDVEKEIIKRIAMLPEVLRRAADDLKPNLIVDYANKLAITFNSFYQQYPVIKAETSELKMARLALVSAVVHVLGNVLDILGIPKLEKM